jgi:hypothetical protein
MLNVANQPLRLSVIGLEMGITPVAEKIREIYHCHPQEISAHLAEIRGLAQAVGYEEPSPYSTSPPTPSFPLTPTRSSSAMFSSSSLSASARTTSTDRIPIVPTVPTHAQIAAVLNMQVPPNLAEMRFPSFQLENPPKRVDSFHPESAPISPMTEEPPPILQPLIVPESKPVHQLNRAATITIPPSIVVQPHTPNYSHHRRSVSVCESIPSIVPSNEGPQTTNNDNNSAKLSLYPSIDPVEQQKKRSESTASQLSEFERSQFRNAVILCDVYVNLI